MNTTSGTIYHIYMGWTTLTTA